MQIAGVEIRKFIKILYFLKTLFEHICNVFDLLGFATSNKSPYHNPYQSQIQELILFWISIIMSVSHYNAFFANQLVKNFRFSL